MAQAQIVPLTIPAGESLSDSLDVTAGEASYVLTPGEWDPANVTFQISFDNVTFWDLFDEYGREVMLACEPGVGVLMHSGLQSTGYFKIRSGTRDNPVPQSEDRNFKVVFWS